MIRSGSPAACASRVVITVASLAREYCFQFSSMTASSSSVLYDSLAPRIVARSLADCLFIAADGINMLGGRLEPGVHRINADVRCPQLAPLLRLTHQLVGIAVARVHTRLDAHGGQVAALLADIVTQAFEACAHAVIG